MTNIFTSLVLVTLVVAQSVKADNDYCYFDSDSPYRYFGTKTSYIASRNSQMNVPKNCIPVYVWALIRHGTRYPNENTIQLMNDLNRLKNEILSNHKEGRGKLCKDDVKNLKKWSSSVFLEQENQLTNQGYKDMEFLANNYRRTFRQLLTPSEESCILQSSQYKRAKDSAVTFVNKLLGLNFLDEKNKITENEELLHILKHCPRFTKEIEDNSTIYNEVELFKKSNLMQNLISEVSTRLGYEKNLFYDSIKVMYSVCAYENAWYIDSRPPFCAAFLPEHMKILEYLEDMTDYYVHGYGNNLIEKVGCVVVKDMLTSLSNAAKNQNTRRATFYFSHAEMIFPTTVKLGLHHDVEPLKHDNYERMKERKWKTSLFNSFASNIAAVLYKCDKQQGAENIVLFYQNERQIVPPKCADSRCTLEDLQQKFPEVFEESSCNLRFCNTEEQIQKSSGNVLLSSFCIVMFDISIYLVFLKHICK